MKYNINDMTKILYNDKYTEVYYQYVNEGIKDNIIGYINKLTNFFKKHIKSILSSFTRRLNNFQYGKSIEFDLSIKKPLKESNGGIQSHYGYYVEFVSALTLFTHLKDNNQPVVVVNNNTILNGNSALIDIVNEKKLYIQQHDTRDKKTIDQELRSLDLHGKSIGDDLYIKGIAKISKEVNINIDHYEIALVGNSEKGISTVDIKFRYVPLEKTEMVDLIVASIKSLKSAWNVNLGNFTLISFLSGVGLKDNSEIKNQIANIQKYQGIRHNILNLINAKPFIKGNKYICQKGYNLVQDGNMVYCKINNIKSYIKSNFNKYNELEDVMELIKKWQPVSWLDPKTGKLKTQNELKKATDNNGKKLLNNIYKVSADAFLTEYSELLNKVYSKKSKVYNKNLLRMLGFMKGEEIYIARGRGDDVKLYTLDSVPSFKKLVDDLLNNTEKLNIVFSHKKTTTASLRVEILLDGKSLLKGNWSVGTTGSFGDTKFNAMTNLKNALTGGK